MSNFTYFLGMFLFSVSMHLVRSFTSEGQKPQSFLLALLTVTMRRSADASVAVFTLSALSVVELYTSIISIVLSIP